MEELIPIFLFLCIAAVLIFRPMTKRLGMLLEEMARDRRAMRSPDSNGQMDRVVGLLENLNTRLDLMEDRMEFVERLSDSRPRRSRITGVVE
ncbi:MAG TPA: hypothetical protein VJ957_01695 [Longimicrobiales bacterium]|nr:hypothetical protein [Longimicrobiales bacterium]